MDIRDQDARRDDWFGPVEVDAQRDIAVAQQHLLFRVDLRDCCLSIADINKGIVFRWQRFLVDFN